MFKEKYSSPLCPGEKVTADQLDTDRGILALQRAIDRLSRRKFLGGLSGATALAVTAGFIEMPKLSAQTTAAPAIPDVLNFALNLEYLEANLYYFASTGQGIPASYSGTPTGAATLPPAALYTAVKANAQVYALAQALAQDELNHISDLRTAISSLGGTPVNQPQLNYAPKGAAVTTVAQFLATARQFTALGNSAYAGAAQFLVSNPAVLTTAAQILGAEGQHMGAVNYQCIAQGVTAAFSTNAAAYIDPMDQPPSTTQYFTVFVAGQPNVNTTTQAPGLTAARTTSQDLGVVYGASTPTAFASAGITSGGFFPAGVNGAIKST